MKICTLGFLFRNGKIILAKKKRVLGVGKWNGYGGKMEEGEDEIGCLIRETQAECGVTLQKEKCIELGYVDFYFKDDGRLNQRVFIYCIDEFEGYPKESEEMGKPEEFDVKDMPYEEMLAGDDQFMPLVIDGKKFRGEIHFSEKEGKLYKCVIVEIPDEKSEIKLK